MKSEVLRESTVDISPSDSRLIGTQRIVMAIMNARWLSH